MGLTHQFNIELLGHFYFKPFPHLFAGGISERKLLESHGSGEIVSVFVGGTDDPEIEFGSFFLFSLFPLFFSASQLSPGPVYVVVKELTVIRGPFFPDTRVNSPNRKQASTVVSMYSIVWYYCAYANTAVYCTARPVESSVRLLYGRTVCT
jgi:hypothetical protein